MLCKTRLKQFKPVLTSWKDKTKGYWPPIFTKNSIIRNYNRDWSCEQAIFVLHNLRVYYITEELYFHSMNSPIQWYKVMQLVCEGGCNLQSPLSQFDLTARSQWVRELLHLVVVFVSLSNSKSTWLEGVACSFCSSRQLYAFHQNHVTQYIAWQFMIQYPSVTDIRRAQRTLTSCLACSRFRHCTCMMNGSNFSVADSADPDTKACIW